MILRAVLASGLLLAACGSPRPASLPTAHPGSCTAVRVTPDLGRDHLPLGSIYTYPSFPPTSGPHDPRPLPAGFYDRPLVLAPSGSSEATIFRAVHSLEHGYVLVFFHGLSASQRARLRLRFGDQRKVIVAPAPAMRSTMALAAWDRIQECSRFDMDAIAAFIARFRERTAPEIQAA